jgi:cellulose 1,4-beta-cellobiosidase
MEVLGGRLASAAMAATLTVVCACQEPDTYLRHAADGGTPRAGAAGKPGGAGTSGSAGAAVSTGAAGKSGAAGATSTAGTGAAGVMGTAGTGAAAVSGAAGTAGGQAGSTSTGGAGSGAGAAGSAGTLSGAGGTGSSTGTAGTAGAPCPGCKLAVNYTCFSDASDQAAFLMDVANRSSNVFLLGDLTLRYWYTADAGKEQELNCDDALVGCAKIITAKPLFQPVTPPRTGANMYVEIAFPAGSGAVDAMGSTGRIQLRLHNKDYAPMNQSDDYSADCATKTAHESTKITAYIKGVLVGGIEPP